MTAPDVNADVRARFEAGFGKCPDAQLTRKGDGYLFTATDLRWEGYRAAHADLSGEVRELVEVVRELADDLREWGATDFQLAMRAALTAALAQNTQGEEPALRVPEKAWTVEFRDITGALCRGDSALDARPIRGCALYLHAERARVPDSDRIDWMEANARSVSFGKAPQQGYWVHVQGADSVYSHNESLRGAIDSARGAQAAQLAAATSQPKDAGEVEL